VRECGSLSLVLTGDQEGHVSSPTEVGTNVAQKESTIIPILLKNC
jgi:hypothetical protein